MDKSQEASAPPPNPGYPETPPPYPGNNQGPYPQPPGPIYGSNFKKFKDICYHVVNLIFNIYQNY